MLTHLEPQAPKKWEKREEHKTPYNAGVFGGGKSTAAGRRPLSPTDRRETPTARTRPGGPWPDFACRTFPSIVGST